jgi:hypothetical protein
MDWAGATRRQYRRDGLRVHLADMRLPDGAVEVLTSIRALYLGNRRNFDEAGALRRVRLSADPISLPPRSCPLPWKFVLWGPGGWSRSSPPQTGAGHGPRAAHPRATGRLNATHWQSRVHRKMTNAQQV